MPEISDGIEPAREELSGYGAAIAPAGSVAVHPAPASAARIGYTVSMIRNPPRPFATALLGLSLCLWLAAGPAEAGKAVALSASRVHLNPENPKAETIGRLVWRGGIEITSDDSRIGGLSGLLVSDDGTELIAVSDFGRWLSARLVYDDRGHLRGLARAEHGRLHGPDGERLRGKTWKDAESLARLADGSILVSFEREHRIWRYPAAGNALAGRPEAWEMPAGLPGAPGNGGLEALVALVDGSLLALTEEQTYGAGVAAYLWREGGWSRLGYVHGTGFRPTGAARLPDGDILVVERQNLLLAGPSVRLVRLAAADIRPGARLEGREIARWGLPLTVDNFEAVATRRGPGGETLIYLLSDDNFHPLQRTLLVMFALKD
jgi:hypothetical protein